MQRCRAKSKRSGVQCKNWAIKGWGVCRMHGARGGPMTQGGLSKCKLSSLKHGFYTEFEKMELRRIREDLKAARQFGCNVGKTYNL